MLNHQRQKLKAKSKTVLRRGCGAPHKRHSCLNIIITSAIVQKRRFRGQCISWCLRWRFAGHVLLGTGAWENPRGAHQNCGAPIGAKLGLLTSAGDSRRICEGEQTELCCFSSQGKRCALRGGGCPRRAAPALTAARKEHMKSSRNDGNPAVNRVCLRTKGDWTSDRAQIASAEGPTEVQGRRYHLSHERRDSGAPATRNTGPSCSGGVTGSPR